MSTIQERLAPFDWRELENDTEFYVEPRVVSEVSVRLLDELLAVYCADDYDDAYDHLPSWEANRVSVRRVRLDRKFISKKKENK